MSLPGYDTWLLRGSGAFSTEHEVTLDEPCPECGGTDGMVYKNDYGCASLECMTEGCGHIIDDALEPDEPDYEPDDDYDPRDYDD